MVVRGDLIIEDYEKCESISNDSDDRFSEDFNANLKNEISGFLDRHEETSLTQNVTTETVTQDETILDSLFQDVTMLDTFQDETIESSLDSLQLDDQDKCSIIAIYGVDKHQAVNHILPALCHHFEQLPSETFILGFSCLPRSEKELKSVCLQKLKPAEAFYKSFMEKAFFFSNTSDDAGLKAAVKCFESIERIYNTTNRLHIFVSFISQKCI
jgi:hypothetical protein